MKYNMKINKDDENYKFHKNNLNEITLETFKEIIAYVILSPITNLAPLGFSGENYYLYGKMVEKEESQDGKWHRVSLVSFRNYCGKPELLITDYDGRFLFYGSFDINDYEKIANLLYNCFLGVKDKIDKIEEKTKIDIDLSKAKLSIGFDMLKKYQKAK